jgi:peptidoglycan/LPS O-acetylase OafA/YrhL
LWQQPFTFSHRPAAIELVLLLIVSVSSYFLIEKPFLSLKNRATRVRVPEAFPGNELAEKRS